MNELEEFLDSLELSISERKEIVRLVYNISDNSYDQGGKDALTDKEEMNSAISVLEYRV